MAPGKCLSSCWYILKTIFVDDLFQMKYMNAYAQENEQYKAVFVVSDEVHGRLHPGE